MPSKISFNWLYGSFLLIHIAKVALALSSESVTVIADYPKGCYGGPGPAKDGGNIKLLDGTCIYSMRGKTSAKVPQESAGIKLATNIPGRGGAMKLQLDVVGDTAHLFGRPKISVKTSGLAFLKMQYEDIRFWWKPAPGDRVYKSDDKGERVDTDWYNISGLAVSNGISLFAHVEDVTLGSDVPLILDSKVDIHKVDGGWSYHIGYGAGVYYNWSESTKYHWSITIAGGILYD
ncbi:hypothetical protein FOZ61_007884 [Perkinsus olseni]|uniref:Uncharacterized protein n=1 Tax=Perkinsus olseni TaxID=32597 RepID=A0A7J6MUS1_PEROL|nr:hypothetical protein FOZ61_007884 [Perkinsus olseni]KAF4675293.1 hypothetical protein FOL46_002232 [Perkinsus olseni]